MVVVVVVVEVAVVVVVVVIASLKIFLREVFGLSSSALAGRVGQEGRKHSGKCPR